jgi:uncharacterized membrane protein
MSKLCALSYVLVLLTALLWHGLWFPNGALLIMHMVLLGGFGAIMALMKRAGRNSLGGIAIFLYFNFAVMEAYAVPPERVPALMVTGFCCLYFFGLWLWVRKSRALALKV